MVRTVGTQKESMSQEWKDWYKQRGWCAANPHTKVLAVMWSELK